MIRCVAAACAIGIVCIGAYSTSPSAADAPVTFHKDVLPILQKNCQSCHRPGQIAPMSLVTFRDARPWARAMKTKVESRQMPPWFADPHYGKFSNDRSLSRRDIDTIVAWVDSGAAKGNDRDLPAVPRFADLPELDIHLLNRPDLVSAGAGEYTDAVGLRIAVAIVPKPVETH